jgi:hypothetical protein
MGIEELIELLSRKLSYMHSRRSSAEAAGDLEVLAIVDEQIGKTQDTLSALRAELARRPQAQ